MLRATECLRPKRSPVSNQSSCHTSRTTTPKMRFTLVTESPYYGPTSRALPTSSPSNVVICSRLSASGMMAGRLVLWWMSGLRTGRLGANSSETAVSQTRPAVAVIYRHPPAVRSRPSRWCVSASPSIGERPSTATPRPKPRPALTSANVHISSQLISRLHDFLPPYRVLA